jgi:hypothetical protein
MLSLLSKLERVKALLAPDEHSFSPQTEPAATAFSYFNDFFGFKIEHRSKDAYSDVAFKSTHGIIAVGSCIFRMYERRN